MRRTRVGTARARQQPSHQLSEEPISIFFLTGTMTGLKLNGDQLSMKLIMLCWIMRMDFNIIMIGEKGGTYRTIAPK